MDDSTAPIQQISVNDDKSKVVDAKQQNNAADIENQSEKYDISPENLEKSNYDITPNDDLSTSGSVITKTVNINPDATITNSLTSDKSEARNKSTGFAFTIDFNEGKTVDNRKYKEMAERFQNRQMHQQEQRRHRRGVSLSKLDDSRKSSTSLHNIDNGPVTVDDLNASNISTVASKPPFKQRTKLDDVKNDDIKCDTKVAMRKPRLAAQIPISKDSTKRHSWSPRSSLNYEKIPQMPQHQHQHQKDEPSRCVESTGSFQPKSTILQRAMESNSIRCSTKSSSKMEMSETLAKESTVDHVNTTPLEYVRTSDDDGSIGDASQATYTLDGDNYTEEEKERMSIDKLGKSNFDLSIDSRSRQDLSKNYGSGLRNALQVNYLRDVKVDPKHTQHNSTETDQLNVSSKASSKTAKSYLDKFKTRVKTIGDRTFLKSNAKALTNEKRINLQVVRANDSSSTDADHGVFTSITACGVLNKQNQTDNTTNANRKQSLTKFQIDSSEYIQPKVDESLMNSYTDYEKAKHNEYKLNIFSTVSAYTSSGTSPVQTDDDNLSIECGDDKSISIKTAPTKNDWIQEWAKNARKRNNMLASSATASPKLQHFQKTVSGRSMQSHLPNKDDDRMSQSYDTYFNHADQIGDEVIEVSSDECVGQTTRQADRTKVTKPEFGMEKMASNNILRPPISPTKIPSPMHTQLRARSTSANRSFRRSNADLDNSDTEMYLEKTAAAISSLQKIHRKNSSPQSPLSPLSPMRKTVAGDFSSVSPMMCKNYEKSINLRPMHLHKRNLSLDAANNKNHEPYNSAEMFNAQELTGQMNKRHVRHIRHNSYENKQIQLSSAIHGDIDQTMSRATFIEQQRLLNKYFGDMDRREEHARRASSGNVDASVGSPIRRSSSFCNRNIANIMPTKAITPTTIKKPINRHITGSSSLQKSASSSSFKKLVAASSYSQHYEAGENETFFINGRDNLRTTHDELLYSSDESDIANSTTGESGKYESDRQTSEPPISHTRYNKAFLMRMEQNKQIASSSKGVIACPNTPELPRRAANQRASFNRDPTSVPRDSSLSRMKQDLPNLQTTKKVLTQVASKDSSSSTSSIKQRVLPKYMDISKYKPAQGQSFLKRDESKSTLINRNEIREIRKSPSAIGLSKGDPMRVSGRVKSAGAKPSTPINSKDSKAREVELAMWRRRATYDPMKAAAEGRKKLEEAKKSAQSSKDTAVIRSQSFHSGVGHFNNHQLRQQFIEDSFNKNRWTAMSTESSDEEEFGDNT